MRFTVFLVKQGYKVRDRYSIQKGNVQEHSDSVFAPGVTILQDARINNHIQNLRLRQVTLVKAAGPSHQSYILVTKESIPTWKGFWQITNNIKVRSASAVIFIEQDNRLFAICHGRSRFFLDQSAVEYDFGLKSAINIIDPAEIKSARIFTPSEIAMSTQRQAGKKTKIESYEINIFNSLLKSIDGYVKAANQKSFKKLYGADSISFDHDGDQKGLLQKIKELHTHYGSTSYKKTPFDWIDNFRAVRDPVTVSQLDVELQTAIQNQDSSILLNFPSAFDEASDTKFSVSGFRQSSAYPSLDIEILYSNARSKAVVVDTDFLKTQSIIAADGVTGDPIAQSSIYRSLFFETTYSGLYYFLESGTWYVVDKNYLSIINNTYALLENNAIQIPLPYETLKISTEARRRKKNSEYIYNEKLSGEYQKTQATELLDTKLVSHEKSRTEVCDILTDMNGKTCLVHVKYKYGSSALSHLFNQGIVSASMLIDINFRKAANSYITNRGLAFPLTTTLDRSKYKVVYAIISKKNQKGKFTLPLFSKITLHNAIKELTRLNYDSQLAYIEEKP